MPTYTAPNFNLVCDIYAATAPPDPGILIYADVPCQYYVAQRAAWEWNASRIIRIPWLAPFGRTVTGLLNVIVVTSNPFPAMTDTGFLVEDSYFVHVGFPNQYQAFVVRPILLSDLPTITVVPWM